MRRTYVLAAALLAGLSAAPRAAQAPSCEPIGELRFVCGPTGPEDLVAVPRTPWLVSSAMAGDGGIYVVDTARGTSTKVFPTATSAERLDAATYGSCPGPLQGEDRTSFRTHGLYLKASGRVYMTGTQALVRMLLAQKQRDAAAGLVTGGFVSGYRGSPLGAVDQELWKARKHLDAHQIKFNPGLNEELAATSVWGSQMVNLDPNATVDGVFALWYGKGPGVDRSGDVFKHGNIAGCSKHGGVLLIAGDDHSCKSSSLPHQSEHAFIAAMIPVLNPSGVREFIELILRGRGQWDPLVQRYVG